MTKFNAAFILLGLSHFPRWDIVDLPTCASCQNVEAFEARIKLFCILSLRAFKQHIDSFFQYFSDMEQKSKRYNECDSGKSVYHQPSVYFRLPCLSVTWRQLGNMCTKIFPEFPSCWSYFRGHSREFSQSNFPRCRKIQLTWLQRLKKSAYRDIFRALHNIYFVYF